MSCIQPMHQVPPPPPPQLGLPPLPPGPPPVVNAYQFGSGASQRSYQSHLQDKRHDFSFRSHDTAPQYPPEGDSYRVPGHAQYDAERQKRQQNSRQRTFNDRRQDKDAPRDGFRPHGRRVSKYPPTAERPLLQFKRGETPERMLGMNENENTRKRFLDIDDMSDSVEEAMEESEEEIELAQNAEVVHELVVHASPAVLDTGLVGLSGESTSTGMQKNSTADLSHLPKWSNPEYYTALPPPDESQRKKRDVVKLIRKARVLIEKESNVASQVSANDDFISFNVGEDQSQTDDESHYEQTNGFNGRGVPGAPLGPRSSHYQAVLQGPETKYAPGTRGAIVSVADLGPPPALNVSQDKPVASAGEALLGGLKRKRSLDSIESEPLRPPKRGKKGPGPASTGHLLAEWAANDRAKAIPWIRRDHRQTEHSGFRLHKEICDFYEFVKPQKFEQIIRDELLARIHSAVKQWSSGCEVHCFGSFAAGLYLPNADMDLVVLSETFREYGVPTVCQSYSQMNKLAEFLERNGIAERWSIEVISKAKVPIIKFIDRITQLKVDVSFENNTGIVANRTFAIWKDIYPAMPIIVTIIKQFLMMRGLNEVANGGLGGFSVTCLVVSLLQNIPRVQTNEILPEEHLGEILLEFLDLYGNLLDIARTGIRMDPPGYFDKRILNTYKPSKPDRLAIIDPNKYDNDISGGSRNIQLIFERFSKAREEILFAMTHPDRPSFLSWMLGGDYNDFLWQRKRLRKIYTDKGGNVDELIDAGSIGVSKTKIGYTSLAPDSMQQQIPLGASMESIHSRAPLHVATKKASSSGWEKKEHPIGGIGKAPDIALSIDHYQGRSLKTASTTTHSKTNKETVQRPKPPMFREVTTKGFISQAKEGSAIRNAEHRSFLFKKKHPQMKVPYQLSKRALKNLKDNLTREASKTDKPILKTVLPNPPQHSISEKRKHYESTSLGLFIQHTHSEAGVLKLFDDHDRANIQCVDGLGKGNHVVLFDTHDNAKAALGRQPKQRTKGLRPQAPRASTPTITWYEERAAPPEDHSKRGRGTLRRKATSGLTQMSIAFRQRELSLNKAVGSSQADAIMID